MCILLRNAFKFKCKRQSSRLTLFQKTCVCTEAEASCRLVRRSFNERGTRTPQPFRLAMTWPKYKMPPPFLEIRLYSFGVQNGARFVSHRLLLRLLFTPLVAGWQGCHHSRFRGCGPIILATSSSHRTFSQPNRNL